MDIKKQIQLSVIISLILAVGISVSIGVSYLNIQDLEEQESLAADVVRAGYELSFLANDYIINGEPRARLQWEERYNSLQSVVSQLKPGNTEEADSIEAIRDYNEIIAIMFREIPELKSMSGDGVQVDTFYQQVTWSRNNVQSQELIYEAWRLRHLYNNDVIEAQFWNYLLVFALMVAILVIIIVNYLLISHRLVQSLREITTGSQKFATGDLEYRIPVTHTDEMGEIAAGLNVMAGEIKSVTASRDELNREIAERRQAEKALKESETKFHQIFEKANDGIEISEMKDDGYPGNYIDINEVACRMVRYTRDEMLQMNPVDISTDYFSRPFDDIIKEIHTVGQATFETEHRRKDGTLVPVEVSTSTIMLLEKRVLLSVVRDITERKKAEKQLRESETRFRMMSDWTYDWEYWLTYDRDVVYCSPSIERITGYSAEEFIADKNLIDRMIHPDDRALWEEHIPLHTEDNQSENAAETEFRIVTKDGTTRWIGHVCRAIFADDGTWAGMRISNRDITERKIAEEALRTVNKKLNLLSGITRHDIINQVMGAEMILEMMEMEGDIPPDSKTAEDLKTITNSLKTIERQIVFTRDYQELGVKAPNWQKMGRLIDETGATISNGLTVKNEVGTLEIYADPLFEKVIYNLFDNAARYGEKITSIRFFCEETPQGLKLICEDDGVGVPADVKEKIFNRQYFKHTGLGLFLSQEILSITGMTIAETGVPGVGARFEISVPEGMWRLG